MKKRCVICVLLAAVIMLGSCGTAGTNQASEAAPVASGPQSISLWSYYETQAQRDALDELAEGFNISQSEYVLSWEYIPMTDFQRQLNLGFTGGELPDLVLIDNPNMSDGIRTGLFADITEQIAATVDKADFFAQLWDTVEMDGRIYGLPYCCNNIALIYNTRMLEEKGLPPPQTPEELLAAAAALTTPECAGIAISAVKGEQGAFQFLPWVLPEGGGTYSLGNEYSRQGLELIYQLAQKEYISKDCINWSQVDVARAFAAEQCAMMENGPWILPMLEEAGVDYGITKLPFTGNAVITGGENIGVISGKNEEGAMAVIEYYCQDTVMQRICERSYSLPPKQQLATDTFQDNPEMTVFVRQMEHSVNRNQIKAWPSVSRLLTSSLYNLITGESTPEQELEHIQRETGGLIAGE